MIPYFFCVLCLLSLSSESRGGPVCHPFGDTRSTSGVRQQPGNAAMPRGRFTAPLPFRHLICCDAELTAPHFQLLQPPLPPQEPGWAVWGSRAVSLPQPWQTGRGSQGAAFQNPLNRAVLWYLLNLYNSVICCQYISAKETKIRLFFLLPQPMKNLSCAREETLCVCVCTFRGGKNRVSVNLFSS